MKKPLIKCENLKQFFKVGSKGIIFKTPIYLKANNSIDLTIYDGETFGLVGESGCGKSTLGRVILQLYPQIRGNTYYYGRTTYEYKPKYVKEYLKDIKAKYANYQKLLAKAETKNSQLIYDQAIREYSLLTHFAGELLLHHDLDEVTALLNQEFDALVNNNNEALTKVREKMNQISNQYIHDEKYQFLKAQKDFAIDLSKLTYEEMRHLRTDLQIIFQDPYSSLNPKMTVGQIISEALIAHGLYKKNSQELEDYVKEIMIKCGLEAHLIHRYPHQFSGGQRQRIGIARALALKPKFIVCDEAVSALDVSIQAQIIELLEELKEKEKLTYLFISHDLSVINTICDRIGVMYFGNMVEIGDKDSIFDEPKHPYTQMLLSAIPSLDDRNDELIYNEEYSIENAETKSNLRYTDDRLQELVKPLVKVGEQHYVQQVEEDN